MTTMSRQDHSLASVPPAAPLVCQTDLSQHDQARVGSVDAKRVVMDIHARTGTSLRVLQQHVPKLGRGPVAEPSMKKA